jgi:hypothetical protein
MRAFITCNAVALHLLPTVLECLGYSSSVCMIWGAVGNFYYAVEGSCICGWCTVSALVFDQWALNVDQKDV